MNQQDLRVIKTKRNIQNSFLNLLGKKDFSSITVQEILEEALINRSTFYAHYTDKYDLARCMCQAMQQEFEQMVQKRFSLEEPTQIVKSIENVYQDVYEKREVYSRLWRIQTEEIHLYEDMSVYLSEQFLKAYVQEKNVEKAEYVAEIYSAIIMTSIKWCITHGVDSMKEMISFFSPKLLSAFQTFLA